MFQNLPAPAPPLVIEALEPRSIERVSGMLKAILRRQLMTANGGQAALLEVPAEFME